MIVIKIELWPFGDEDRAKEIGRMYIANDGAGGPMRGDYKVAVCKRGTTEVPREIYLPDAPELAAEQPKATRAGEVKDYPRLSYNVWRLIARACLATFPEERAPKGVIHQLDATVMVGLQLLASNRDCDFTQTEHDAMHDARTWLDAAFDNLETAKLEEARAACALESK